MPEDATRAAILQAALAHVPFDGWSDATLRAAAADSGVNPALARALFPRGGVDLALEYHRAGDRAMLRLEGADRELVRRGSALFALPQNAAAGARAVWGTADAIWTALGDTANDINWYSKRASLSAVYGATVLYWLGDESTGHQATRDFLDRRIEGVMRFEKAKAALAGNPLGKALLSGPFKVLERIHAPKVTEDLPGRN